MCEVVEVKCIIRWKGFEVEVGLRQLSFVCDGDVEELGRKKFGI